MLKLIKLEWQSKARIPLIPAISILNDKIPNLS